MFKHRIPVLHPVQFVLFPIVSLYASNLGQMPFSAAVRSMAVAAMGVTGILALLRVALHDWHRAGLVTSLGVGLVYTYGRAYEYFMHRGETSWLLAAWVLLFMLGLAAAARVKTVPSGLTRLLNLISALALAMGLSPFVPFTVEKVQTAGIQVHLDQQAIPYTGAFQAAPARQPDIYYIILDGYGRADVLDELYGLDNASFLSFLRGHGFYVASSSRSNYAQTALSLASSLNMNYLDELADLPPESEDRGLMHRLINDSEVMRFLEAQGYQSVAFSNAFPVTELNEADQFILSGPDLNNFEIMLLSENLAGENTEEALAETYRDRVLAVRDDLDELLRTPSDVPRFVFIHLILPHPPFVFHADGTLRPNLAAGDGSHYPASRAEYRQGYREQVQFANRYTQGLITSILEQSAHPPVILLQGDHGPGLHLDWESRENSCLRERFSILNAYYLPGQHVARLLTRGITPVNSFRVVLSAYFGADLPRLPDRSYFSLWDTPYRFEEVTDEIEPRCE